MMRTKPFLIMVVVTILFLLWIVFVDIGIETVNSEQPVGTVIMAEPRDAYGVEYEAVDEGYMQRAIFIEKVRSTLLSDPVPERPPEPVVEYTAPEPVVEYRAPKPIVPTTTTFSTSSMSLPTY